MCKLLFVTVFKDFVIGNDLIHGFSDGEEVVVVIVTVFIEVIKYKL